MAIKRLELLLPVLKLQVMFATGLLPDWSLTPVVMVAVYVGEVIQAARWGEGGRVVRKYRR